MRAYLDACVVIYLVDATETIHRRAVNVIQAVGKEPSARLLTSRLSLLECRVRAFRNGDTELIARYARFFGADRLDLVEIDARVIDRATELRAKYGFRSPDAIHLATAIESGASVFLTGDLKLKQCVEVDVRTIQE